MVTNFSQTMDSCNSQIIWNIYFCFNKWHANYKILAKFGKDYRENKIDDSKRMQNWSCIFYFIATIGGNLHTKNANSLNHIHKDSKYLLSVIIILGTNINDDETGFYDGENMNDIGKRAHVLNHSHGRCDIGSFDKILHEG